MMKNFTRVLLLFGLIAQLLAIPTTFPTNVAHAAPEADPAISAEPSRTPPYALTGQPRSGVTRDQFPSDLAVPLQQGDPTTLTVDIVSSPWTVLDHNNPTGSGESVPRVFVVEARVTNTGPVTAGDLQVVLDYDSGSEWVLLPGESVHRTLEELPSGETYHAYWMAQYSTVIGASHQYTVTAEAHNASPVSTSTNYYGDPEPGKTVKTRAFQSTGNSGVTQTGADVSVGVAFVVTTTYDLGTNPQEVIFGPVGNVDFAAGAYRLISSQVRFYNDAGTQETTVDDRLYFDAAALPDFADNAEISYQFIALTLGDTRLCTYTGVGFGSSDKYDQFYCSESRGTAIPISGSLTLSLTKQSSSDAVQQGDLLTYTLQYENYGDASLAYAWVWDNIDTSIASIISDTIAPPADPDETTESRVAWYIGDIVPDATGTFTFTVLVDGAGQDLVDGTQLVNEAFFGINSGSLPAKAALTSTLSTTVEAPVIALEKTDGRETAEPGDALQYTVRITNTGSVMATNLVITDHLPADVSYVSGTAFPAEDRRTGQTLVWDTLPSIPPYGGSLVITIPVTVGGTLPDGTILSDQLTLQYANTAGHTFTPRTTGDTTRVNAPVLSITKSGAPDPVLTGHSITYTLEYANDGPGEATHVVITDVVPLSTTYNVGSCQPAPCAMGNGIVSWTVGTVPGISSGSVQFSVLVDEDLETGSVIENTTYGLTADQTGFVPGSAVTTQVNRDAAFFVGHTFVDADVDGVFDPGESALSGVTVTLPGATVPVMLTGADGAFHFRVENEGPVAVTADLPADYLRTTPGTVYTNSVLGITQTVDFGYLPVGSPYGVLYGTVFEDANRNGTFDLGELGLAGVDVASTGAVTSPLTTNRYGQYTFRYDAAGSVTLSETNLDGYVSTTPDVVDATVVTGAANPANPIDFGDFRGIQITGQVFDDVNVNGRNDAEGGVAGATVAAGDDSFTTGSTGVYTLYVTLSDSSPILVTETDPPGYVSTDAVPGSGMSRIDDNTLRIDSPMVGTTYEHGDFGDVLTTGVVTVRGQVWDDDGSGGGGLADGSLGGTEGGLAGAVVSLSSGLSMTTGADGLFVLYGPPGQPLTLTETNPDGTISTNAIPGGSATKVDNDTLLLSAQSGGAESTINLFGDVDADSVAVVSGTVFDDANENGQLDTGESGIPGVEMTLEIEGGDTIPVPTDAAGRYAFAVAPGTNVRITADRPAGTYPTTPERIIVRPPAAGVYPDNDFGFSDDPDTAVVFGIVFDDVDSDGQQDFGEPGLAGAVVSRNAAVSITTTGNGLVTGTFSFPIATAGVHAFHETNPPGYRSTTPDDVNIDVDLGQGYNLNFGDTNSTDVASVYGTVFEDLNSNGVQDPTEVGLSGVVISATMSSGIVTATTQPYGHFTYRFDFTEPGFHTLTERDPALPGYRSTTPDVVNLFVALGNSYVVDFGDTNDGYSTIMGTVFDDVSADGVQDPGELGIADVLVSLSNGQTTRTGAQGGYTFPITDSGHLQVIETDPPGYHSTTPNEVTVDVAALGQTYQVDFGDDDNAAAVSIFGTVFEDRNVNGLREPSEIGISGVTVQITDTFDVPPAPFITNQWGQYTFQIDRTGVFTITETDLPGYVSTGSTAGSAAVSRVDDNNLRAVVDVLGTDLGDNLFGDVATGDVVTVVGTVWHDNGAAGGVAYDGVRDSGEPGLPGALVSLSSGLTQVSADDGTFSIYAPPGEPITVTETNPAGYLSTAAVPGSGATSVDDDTLHLAPLAGGLTSSGHLFGDILPTDLVITKTGAPDPVPGGGVLTYTLTYANDGPSDARPVVITDTLSSQVMFGSVVSQDPALFSFTPAGQDLVWEAPELVAGASGTIVFTVTVRPDAVGAVANTVVITSVTPDPDVENNVSQELTGVGSPDQATIYGTVFDDLDLDGEWDAGEPGIPDVVVTLDGGATATTDGDGLYFFLTDEAGLHTVVESDPEGYFSTTSNEVHLSVSLGQSYRIDFGDGATPADVGAIYGTVFEDSDGDGRWDATELGLEGVVITLNGGVTTTTDLHGRYTFSPLAPGPHVVVETDPEGYFSTTPNEVHVDVLAETDYEVNFGDADSATADFAAIHGTVFDDSDSDTTWDANEVGLEDVRVTLDGSTAVRTDVYGRYTFSTTVAGQHTVVETDPPGYFSTTPNSVDQNVALGQGYQIDFGDVLAAACTCGPDAYEDDDHAGAATLLQTGSFHTQQHDFCDDAVDWISVTVEHRGLYTITTSSWGQRADTVLSVYDRDGQTLVVGNDDYEHSTDYSSIIVWEAPASGVYYLQVANRGGAVGCYTDYDLSVESREPSIIFMPLVVKRYGTTVRSLVDEPVASQVEAVEPEGALGPTGVITHTCPDAFETDDTWTAAAAIEPGLPQVHSFDSDPVMYVPDKDFVWFDVEPLHVRHAMPISFTVTHLTNTVTLMTLYDPQGNVMDVTGTTELMWVPAQPGRYYLSVSPQTSSFGCVDAAGYRLLAHIPSVQSMYLPIILR
jgi:uncharacterized repeat protein (TIGR01451 family)